MNWYQELTKDEKDELAKRYNLLNLSNPIAHAGNLPFLNKKKLWKATFLSPYDLDRRKLGESIAEKLIADGPDYWKGYWE